MSTKEPYDLIVAGSGPAGLTAAATAAGRGLRVLLAEQMPRAGLKLLVTGGGRCNLSHAVTAAQMMEAFGRQGRFLGPALGCLDPEGLRRFFRGLGLETVVRPDGCVFPAAGSSANVLETLLERARRSGVRLAATSRVFGVRAEHGRVAAVEISGETLPCRAVLIATGGRSYPGLGGSGNGYRLASALGHEIVEPLPALVPLLTVESWPVELAGVSLDNVAVRLAGRGAHATVRQGGLLFTHEGLSGPAVLDLSGEVAVRLSRGGPADLELDFTPGADRSAWESRLDGWRQDRGRSHLARLLSEYIPRALADVLCRNCGIDPESATAGRLRRDEAQALPRAVTATLLTVRGTAGFDRAMLTRGGVSLKEVDPATLESRRVKGLYFAGEVLDLDGPCGGYNLQWAFSSGELAGRSISVR
ncbi:NAD(P)/FAD-dependent oxidoreductase [bacterium]|nr:NAD(P)/FAD-dependent oxidoreductase [bacterium]